MTPAPEQPAPVPDAEQVVAAEQPTPVPDAEQVFAAEPSAPLSVPVASQPVPRPAHQHRRLPNRPAMDEPSSPPWSRASPGSTASTDDPSWNRRRRSRDEEGHPGVHRLRAGRRRPCPQLPQPPWPRHRPPRRPALSSRACPDPGAGTAPQPARSSSLGRSRSRADAGSRSTAGPRAPEPQAVPTVLEPTLEPPTPPPPTQPVLPPQPEMAPGEVLEPMTAMRRGIAEHMRRSLDTSAHVTSAIEVDMSRVVALRKKLKPEYEREHGINVTYLAFIARAAIETLKDYPWINGEIRGESIVTRPNINVGFAVELADGKDLIVPVLKNVETLNLLGIAKGVVDIAERARSKLSRTRCRAARSRSRTPAAMARSGTPVISQPQATIGTYAVVAPLGHQDEMGQDVIAIRLRS